MKKLVCVVAAMSILAGCAVAPGSNQINRRDEAAPRGVQPPPGYLDVATFSQERIGAFAAAEWVKQGPTDDERFSRGMRAYADLRQQYYERVNAGLAVVEARNALAAQIIERSNREYLPPGTKGLAVVFRDATYPVSIANFKDQSEKVELLVGGQAYGFKIPDSDVALTATTSKAQPLHRNLLAISDGAKFEGKTVRSQVAIDSPNVWLNYSIARDQFANIVYQNRQRGLQTVLKSSGYVLFQLAACGDDKNFNRLTCSFQLVSTNVESPTLTAERNGR